MAFSIKPNIKILPFVVVALFAALIIVDSALEGEEKGQEEEVNSISGLHRSNTIARRRKPKVELGFFYKIKERVLWMFGEILRKLKSFGKR